MLLSPSSCLPPSIIPKRFYCITVYTCDNWLSTTFPPVLLFNITICQDAFHSPGDQCLCKIMICQNSSHHPHNATCFPCLSTLSTKTTISHFLPHHSNYIHGISTIASDSNSVPNPFAAASFASSRHFLEYPKVHHSCHSSSVDPLWYLCGPYTEHGLCDFLFVFLSIQTTPN